MMLPFHQAGDPQNPTLLLLHPGSALHSVWRPFIRRWHLTFHILAPDLIAEPGRPISLLTLASEVAGLLRRQTSQPAYVVGASVGANVALHLVLNAPDNDSLTRTKEPEKLQAGIPAAECHILPGASHVTFVAQPDPFYQLTTDFLQRQRKQAYRLRPNQSLPG